MTNILLDTNILIYLLGGNAAIRELVDEKTWFISFVSEMELQMKPGLSPVELKAVTSLLKDCFILEINDFIKEKAISNAQRYKLKFADSIILATAQSNNFLLITADSVFKKIAEETNDVLFIREF